MWKTILVIVLIVYFFSSVLGKIIRLLRGMDSPSSNTVNEKQITIQSVASKKEKKYFEDSDYTPYEEIKD